MHYSYSQVSWPLRIHSKESSKIWPRRRKTYCCRIYGHATSLLSSNQSEKEQRRTIPQVASTSWELTPLCKTKSVIRTWKSHWRFTIPFKQRDTCICNGYRSSTLQSSLISPTSNLTRAQWSIKQPPSTKSTWTYSTPLVTKALEYCSTRQASQANSMNMSRQIRTLGYTFLITHRLPPMKTNRQELKLAHSRETLRRVCQTSHWNQAQLSQ